jgi:hypothetical protein
LDSGGNTDKSLPLGAREHEKQKGASLAAGGRPRNDGPTFTHLAVHPGTEREFVYNCGHRHAKRQRAEHPDQPLSPKVLYQLSPVPAK